MKKLIIDKRAIKANLQAVRSKAKGAEIYADLSCDAYGMGLLETARLLRDEGVGSFCVSDPKDAAVLRKNGFYDEHIMMLRSTADSDELEELQSLNVICTVGSYDAAVAINGIAEARHTVCEVQIKIDTGLGRYGFIPSEADKIASIFKYLGNLAIIGVFTSFSENWRSRKQTQEQYETFLSVLDSLVNQGYDVGTTHVCDSAALFRLDFEKQAAVRVGTALSGRIPGKQVSSLKKVGYIEASLEEVGWFPKGHKVNGRVALRKPTRLAVISVGTYYGFGVTQEKPGIKDRLFHRPLTVKIGGQRAKIIGGIGMMHTILDVTNLTCTAGDKAVMDVDPINVKGLPVEYKEDRVEPRKN